MTERVRERPRFQKFFKEPSRTVQASKDECDVNKIMAKYQKNGLLTHLNRFEGKYDDVSNAVEYQEALNIVRESERVFMTLPSSVRAKFENDPGAFMAFVNDPSNANEMITLGLRRAPIEEPGPIPVRLVGDVPEAPK